MAEGARGEQEDLPRLYCGANRVGVLVEARERQLDVDLVLIVVDLVLIVVVLSAHLCHRRIRARELSTRASGL